MKKNYHFSNLIRLVLFILVAGVSGTSLMAQDSAKPKSKWTFLIEPYLMFPNMNGTTGVGELPDVSMDASPSDIFNHFKIGYMLYIEASKDRWSMASDQIYMNLKQDVKTGTLIKSGEVGAKQFAWEAEGMYRILPFLDAGVGTRLNSLKIETHIVQNTIGGGTINRDKELSQTWVDPFIVIRTKSNPASKFIYQVKADIGGFGIGSDLAWQVQAYAGYRFSKLFHVTAGYRILSADYKTGIGSERFLYDVDTFGPSIRFGFNF